MKPRCYAAGPFVAEVTRVVPSKAGQWYIVRMMIKFTNVSPGRIILGYKAGSGLAVDDRGNRYPGDAGRASRVTDIGWVTTRSADPQFALAPGESRSASFESWLGIYRGTQAGTVWSYDLTIDQLEILPSLQVRTAREYAVTFKDLKGGATDAAQDQANAAIQEAGKKALDALAKKLKKPW